MYLCYFIIVIRTMKSIDEKTKGFYAKNTKIWYNFR